MLLSTIVTKLDHALALLLSKKYLKRSINCSLILSIFESFLTQDFEDKNETKY